MTKLSRKVIFGTNFAQKTFAKINEHFICKGKNFRVWQQFSFFSFFFLSFVSLCFYEPGNVFDQFAIKTVDERGETVGHLPKEIFRVTPYFLDLGISMHCKLTSRHYRRSPLVQGTRNQMRSGGQLKSNCASVKVNSPLFRVDSKSLH